MKRLLLQRPPNDWKRAKSIPAGSLRSEDAGPFRRVFYRHPLAPQASALSGQRILFFSDLHIRPQTAACWPRKLRWQGTAAIRDFLLETVNTCRPDHIFFGGDAMAYLCCFDDCMELFRELRCPGLKLGVWGNWDLMNRWLPLRYLQARFEEEAGLRLLSNEAVCAGPMRVFGLEEIRRASPEYRPPEEPFPFECVLSHNPDNIPLFMTPDQFSGISLILCGHTHGGQIRIPLFGAVLTSSVFWKRFEYGLYENRRTHTRMLVSSGLGVTFIRKRIFCPPEAVIIDLVTDSR